MNSDSEAPRGGVRRRHPLVRLLSSIWFGIALLAAILVYSSIISAFPPLRAAFELTEVQAFRHSIFAVLVALFVLSLLAATLLRTRWIWINAGALTTHVGLLILTLGAALYFGRKIEGDVLLQMPAVFVRATIDGRPVVVDRFPAIPGHVWQPSAAIGGRQVRLEVANTQADGLLPVGRVRIAGWADDQPSGDVEVPAGGVWQPTAGGLSVSLITYPSQSVFYDASLPAVYLRAQSADVELVRPLPQLPRYNERYVADAGVLQDENGQPVPSGRLRPELTLLGLHVPTGWFEPWRLPIDVDTTGLPFSLRITGFVPHAIQLQPQQAAEGQPDVIPVLASTQRQRLGRPAVLVDIRGRGEQYKWRLTRWCFTSEYPDVDASPLQVRVPGSDTTWEVVFSRARHDLGATLAGGELVLKYFPGRRSIESFRSDFMAQLGPDAQPHPAFVETNQTLSLGPWTLYQSSYDSEERWRYTILGVGNRHGIAAMNVGWVLVVLGSLYAFYAKPVLLRRAKRKAAASRGASTGPATGAPQTADTPTGAVEVTS